MPLIAVILDADDPPGRSNGLAFAAGWTMSLAAATAAPVLLGSGADAATGDDTPATWTGWLKLDLGLVPAALAVKELAGRPREGHRAQAPGWMKAIDQFTHGRSAGLAALLAGANPKNLVPVVGGAVAVAGSTTGGGAKAVAGPTKRGWTTHSHRAAPYALAGAAHPRHARWVRRRCRRRRAVSWGAEVAFESTRRC